MRHAFADGPHGAHEGTGVELAAALRKQVPKLINNTGAKSVEFKVVIRGGKAVLKALPKH